MRRLAPLPIDDRLPSIIDALRRDRSVVVVAEPGAGKTTRVPPAILESDLLKSSHPNLLLLQPRRVAARAVSDRIAGERGWRLGDEVGYVVRFEKKVGPRTRLKVLTEGILTRLLLDDPYLDGVGAVVLDEFHERSIHTDLAIALLREVRESVRPDLLITAMSATLDAESVSRFLGDCPIVRVAGRAYPVAIEYRPPAAREPIGGQVASAVEAALDRGEGGCLAFLPGADEIRRAARALEPLAAREGLLVVPLHGSLPAEEQDRALRPASRRKVVLATNVAQTSLTIDGIRTVIDSGLERVASYDATRGLDRLSLARISRASADQRAGRAGRTGPGLCLRLWAERETRGMPAFDEPEVRRIDLASTLLLIHAWGRRDPSAFGWFEPPPPERLDSAEDFLMLIGGLDASTHALTVLGRRLLDLPVHPRLGRLLVESAAVDRLRDGATLAAIVSERDFYTGRAEPGESDVLVRLDALAEAEAGGFSPSARVRGIDPNVARQVARVRDDLIRRGRRLPTGSSRASTDADLRRCLLAAYPDRVARRRGRGASVGTMVGGRGVRLEPSSVVHEAEFFLALDPRDDRRGGTSEARVRLASAIDREWIGECFPAELKVETLARFDEEKRRVVGLRVIRYRDLILSEEPNQSVDADRAGAALAEFLRRDAEGFVRSDDSAARWLDRLGFLRRAQPERDWPAFDAEMLGEVVEDACRGRRSEDEARRAGLVAIFQGRLAREQIHRMETDAPDAITVPTGNKVRLDYSGGGSPVLAVRLQELFGMGETPMVAGGRVAVVLHLLGPNYRPVQVTSDLRSFWTTTYFQVRKDLRARYPKHAWPDDPWTARPEARGGRRKGPL